MNDDYGRAFWTHAMFTIIYGLSPILFPWWISAFIAGFLNTQFHVVGTCVITWWEFGKNHEIGCTQYYLNKWGWNISKKYCDMMVTYWIPLGLLVISLILQIHLGVQPVFG